MILKGIDFTTGSMCFFFFFPGGLKQIEGHEVDSTQVMVTLFPRMANSG